MTLDLGLLKITIGVDNKEASVTIAANEIADGKVKIENDD